MASSYSLFGLNVSSELPLPGLPSSPAGGDRVEVRFGTVPAAKDGVSVTRAGDLLLQIPKVGRYRVSRGREIVIDPAPGASERNQRVFLLGSAFGALLHQRGLLPLHANAVEITGRAFLFIGRSGAGKSTLAAWFQNRGHRVLADDVCAITFGVDGNAQALPGVPRLRLWKDALEQSGRSADSFERSFDGQDKFDVPTPADGDAHPRPVGACYVLDRTEDPKEEPHITPLTGLDALDALIGNTYRGGFVPLTGANERHLNACLSLLKAVPMYRAVRRWGKESYDQEAVRLETHAMELCGMRSQR